MLYQVTGLIVVTQRNWLADVFVSAAASLSPPLPALHNMGMDVPYLLKSDRPAWWCPGEHAARLLHQGVQLPLLCPGPGWLQKVPAELLGRELWTGRLEDLGECPWSAGFAKPAEAKTDNLPAAWWKQLDAFQDAAVQAGFPGEAWVQVANRELALGNEYRVLIVGGSVRGSSVYQVKTATGTVAGLDGMNSLPGVSCEEAERFAAEVAQVVASFSPRSYVLDVAETAEGNWIVLEANNTWSANPYDIDGVAYVEGLIAAADYAGDQEEYFFVPDAYQLARAGRMRSLPHQLS